MKKVPFVTKAQIEEIVKKYPTPFHIYDEKGIRENAKALYEAFSWNKGFKEYFAVKATPNPFLMQLLKEYVFAGEQGRGVYLEDCYLEVSDMRPYVPEDIYEDYFVKC